MNLYHFHLTDPTGARREMKSIRLNDIAAVWREIGALALGRAADGDQIRVTNEAGGKVMMFMNLIWAWGHPEVFILILPAFGVFSEVVSTFSGKSVFGYRSMVMATMAICVLAFMVWLVRLSSMPSQVLRRVTPRSLTSSALVTAPN